MYVSLALSARAAELHEVLSPPHAPQSSTVLVDPHLLSHPPNVLVDPHSLSHPLNVLPLLQTLSHPHVNPMLSHPISQLELLPPHTPQSVS